MMLPRCKGALDMVPDNVKCGSVTNQELNVVFDYYAYAASREHESS